MKTLQFVSGMSVQASEGLGQHRRLLSLPAASSSGGILKLRPEQRLCTKQRQGQKQLGCLWREPAPGTQWDWGSGSGMLEPG